MKAILISIKPKWVAKILNGEKTIEIRKTMPKCDLPIDVYIYCTKDKEHLYRHFDNKFMVLNEYNKLCSHNGKVVAKFTLNKVEEISYTHLVNARSYFIKSCSTARWFEQDCCLETWEIDDYLKGKKGYAWHISNLVIFDRPKELEEFNHWVFYKKCEKCPYGKIEYDYGLCSQCCELKSLTKAPQSYQFIEVVGDK